MTKIKAPAPGIYDVPNDVYQSWDAVSKSMLWDFRISPAAFKFYQDNPKYSDAFVAGNALEDAVQRPEIFKDHYQVSVTKTRGANAFIEEEMDTAVQGKELLTPTEAAWIPKAVDAIKRNTIANNLLIENKGRDQLSLVYIDPATGLKCKIRIDRLTSYEGYPAHVDLKSTKDARIRNFQNDAADLGYHLQVAHYDAGTEAYDRMCGRQPVPRRFLFVVVEKKIIEYTGLPKVRILEYGDEDVEYARKLRADLLKRYKKCLDNDEWPDVAPKVETIWVPEYKK